jgi:hypothetical protein
MIVPRQDSTCFNLLLLVFADERRNTSKKGDIRSVGFFIVIYFTALFFLVHIKNIGIA